MVLRQALIAFFFLLLPIFAKHGRKFTPDDLRHAMVKKKLVDVKDPHKDSYIDKNRPQILCYKWVKGQQDVREKVLCMAEEYNEDDIDERDKENERNCVEWAVKPDKKVTGQCKDPAPESDHTYFYKPRCTVTYNKTDVVSRGCATDYIPQHHVNHKVMGRCKEITIEDHPEVTCFCDGPLCNYHNFVHAQYPYCVEFGERFLC